MSAPGSIGIGHLTYGVPPTRRTLSELEARGQLASPSRLLADFGFEGCHLHDGPEPFQDLVIDTGCRLLVDAARPPSEIGTLILVSGIDPVPSTIEPSAGLLDRFRYPAAMVHAELGLEQGAAFSLSQQGCGGLLSAVDLGSRLLRTGQAGAVLILAGDALPAGGCREITYNLIGDATAALLLERDAVKNRIVAFHQQTHSAYWDTPAREQELLAAYFPIAVRVIRATLEQADVDLAAVRWFVPHNVSRRSWQILASLLGLPEEKVWLSNVARVGHTVSCDHVINLVDMEGQGVLAAGDLLVLFTFGFGANWSCLVVEH